MKKEIIRKIRTFLGSNFLFYPTETSFLYDYMFTLFDLLQRSKNIYFVRSVLNELVEKSVISGVKEYTFSMEDLIFYDVFIKNYDGMSFSRGTSKNREEAYAKALGEVFERQSTYCPNNKNEIIYKSILEMENCNENFIPLSNFSKPTRRQIEKLKQNYLFTNDTVFGWSKVIDYINNSFLYAPAQSVYWGYSTLKDEPYVADMSTNGCGGSYDLEKAKESAIFEIIQRDTFFRYWYFYKSPPKIDIETIPKNTDIFATIKSLQKNNFVVEILDLTEIEGIPTVVCVLSKKITGWFLGASTSYSKIHAIERSIQEAISTYMWFNHTIGSNEYEVNFYLEHDQQNNFLDEKLDSKTRVLLWGSKWYKDKQNLFLTKGEVVSFKESVFNRKFSITNYLEKKYENCYINIINERILQDYNYFVVKVIIPKAYSLFLKEASSLPVQGNTYPQNTTPHPFP